MPIKGRDTFRRRKTKSRTGIILPADQLLERGHDGEITAAQVVKVGNQRTKAKSCI